MRFPKHISVTRDINGFLDWVPVIPTTHPYVSGTTGVPLPAILNIELPSPLWWPPGWAVGAHNLTSTVFHKGWKIALDGHDIGVALAHIPALMDNVLTPIHILNSSRKANFSAGEVLANGTPIACCTVFDLGVIPTPMKQCDLLPVPDTGPGSSIALNDCIVGMHWVDLVAGALAALADWVLSTLLGAVGGSGPFELPNGLQAIPFLVRLAGQEYFGYAGDANLTLGLGVGTPLTRPVEGANNNRENNVESERMGVGGVSATLSRSGEDHRWSASAQGRVGNERIGVHGTAGVNASWGGRENAPAEGGMSGDVGVFGAGIAGSTSTNPDTPTTITGRLPGESADLWSSVPEL